MAAPTFVSAGSIVNDLTGAASTTPTPPAHLTGDLLVAVSINAAGATMTTATGGWTKLGEGGTTAHSAVFARIAPGAGTAGPTITASSTDQWALVYVFRGTATGLDYAMNNNFLGTTDATPSTSAITTKGPERFVVACAGIDSNAAYTSGLPPAGWTSSSDLSDANGTTSRFTLITRTENTELTSVAAANVGTFAASHNGSVWTAELCPPVPVVPDVRSLVEIEQHLMRSAVY